MMGFARPPVLHKAPCYVLPIKGLKLFFEIVVQIFGKMKPTF